MMQRAVVTLLAALAAPAWASWSDYRDGRVRFVEPGVTVQRAGEAGAEEAAPNLPFLPGDRVWTDFAGRAEFQFADGSVVRLDARSKLDYLAHDERGGADLVVLSLWSGALYVHVRDDGGRADFEVETPEGRVELRAGGIYRVDVDRGELRLQVHSGEAGLASGRRTVIVRRGQQAFAVRAEGPSRPERFDAGAEEDDFARWDVERGDPWAWAGDSRRHLPDELGAYAYDLDAHGTWDHAPEIGYVWRPRVEVGWRPYVHGRWVWTAWGWTWVAYEPWGWAPFHYGRWGHSVRLGWYWIPGRVWGPAWVSWAVGPDYVGWCPLGWRDRRVTYVSHRHGGRAVPRGMRSHGDAGEAWIYSRRADLGSRDVARRRLEAPPESAGRMQVVDHARTRLSRELRAVDADAAAAPRGAVRRTTRLRPTPGDTVPELRDDPATTRPDVAARRPRFGQRDGRYPADDRASGHDQRRGGATPDAAREERGGRDDLAAPRAGPDRRAWPPAPRTPPADGAQERSPRRGRPAPAEREAPDQDERGAARPRDGGRDRDVLRQFFQPLNDTPEREDGAPERARPRGRDRERQEEARPPRVERRDEPSPPPQSSQHAPGWRGSGAERRRPSGERGPQAAPRSEPRQSAPERRGGDGSAARRRARPKDRDQVE